ncbi:MAG: hypothetical protein ACI4KF_05020 [Huintestinicola sp.]
MVTPDLHSIFFGNGFTDDMIPELEEAQNNTFKELDKLTQKHKLSFSERDAVECAAAHGAITYQYLGFVQGFKWAVYLFTGHKDEETVPAGEEATA